MPTETVQKNIHLAMPPVLVAEMEAVARDEGKTLDEIAQDAMLRYLQDRRWQQPVTYGKGQARSLGLKSADVPRLVAESRREQKHER